MTPDTCTSLLDQYYMFITMLAAVHPSLAKHFFDKLWLSAVISLSSTLIEIVNYSIAIGIKSFHNCIYIFWILKLYLSMRVCYITLSCKARELMATAMILKCSNITMLMLSIREIKKCNFIKNLH